MKIECLKTIKKRDFKENPQNFLTASHLVFLRPFPADRHIATAKSVFFSADQDFRGSCFVSYWSVFATYFHRAIESVRHFKKRFTLYRARKMFLQALHEGKDP